MSEPSNTAAPRPFNYLDGAQKAVYAWAEVKGWNETPPSFGEAIALLHSEVSEALEEFRIMGTQAYYGVPNGAETAHITVTTADYEGHKPLGVPSELADVFIRLVHYCELFGVNLADEYEAKMKYNWTRTHRHGGKKL